MKNQDHIHDLINKYLNGELSPAELIQFHHRLEVDAEFAAHLQGYWGSIEVLDAYKRIRLKEHLAELERIRGRKVMAFRSAKIAVTILLLISIPFYLEFGFKLNNKLEKYVLTDDYPATGPFEKEGIPNPYIPTLSQDILKVENFQAPEIESDPSLQSTLVFQIKSSLDSENESPTFSDPKPGSNETTADAVVATGEDEKNLPVVMDSQVDPVRLASSNEILIGDETDMPQIRTDKPIGKSLVKGNIIDGLTQKRLPGTIVIGKKGVITDENGSFEVELDPGEHTLIAKMLGYQDVWSKVHAVPGEILTLNLLMSASVTQLRTLTITASKFNKPLSDLTASAHIAGQEAIQEYTLNSVEDYLQTVPGLDIIDGQASIRGGSGFSNGAGSRVLVLLDGLPVLQGDAAYSDWDLLPIENVGQIEVLKGATSALYGSSSLNGVVNFRTDFPTEETTTKATAFNTIYLPPRDAAKKWWGTDSTLTPFATGLSFLHGQRSGIFDFLGGVYAYKNQSFRQGNQTEYLRTHIKTRLRFNEKTHAGLNANIQLGHTDQSLIWKNANEGAYQPLESTLSLNTSTRAIVDPFFIYRDTSGNQHKLLSRYYYWDNNQSNATTNQSSRAHQIFGEYQFQRYFAESDMAFTVGMNGNHTISTAELFGDTLHTASNAAAYLQVDQKFWDKLNLSFGARVESNFYSGEIEEKLQVEPVFRIGANYRALDQTYLRASWGQGYRAPTIAEKYISTKVDLLTVYPNADLRPERGWSGEIGFKQGYKLPNWRGFLDVSGFWMEYQDMMEFAFRQWGTFSDPLWGFGFGAVNVGDARITGIEVESTGDGNVGDFAISYNMGYTYVDPKYKHFNVDSISTSSDENILKYRFKHSFKMNVELKYKKLSIGVGSRYHSFMEAIDDFFINDQLLTVAGLEQIGIREFRDSHNSGNLQVDARFTYDPINSLSLSLIGKNILNREYSMRPGQLEAPTNLTLKLSYRI